MAAQAFLVVPEINALPEIEDKAPTALDTSSQSINLDCSTCPYALNSQRNGHHEWVANVPNDLELNFASEDNILKLNGIPFYPIQNPTLPPRLTVSQKKKDAEATTFEGFDGKLGLSYSMEYNEKKFEENSLVTVVMTVMGLDGEMIKVDNVEIQAIKEAGGKVRSSQVYSYFTNQEIELMILSSRSTPSTPSLRLLTLPTPNVETLSAASSPSLSPALTRPKQPPRAPLTK